MFVLAMSCLLLSGICWNDLKNKPKYTLHLPEVEKLEKITINQKEITNKKTMSEILNQLNKKRTTKEKSIQDSPVNTKEKLKIDFHFIEKGVSTIFLYQKNNHFYIEQPYNGIYKITESEYNNVKKLV